MFDLKQEVMAKLMELLERSATGLTVFFYDKGNPVAKREVRKVAESVGHDNVVLIPKSSPNQWNDVLQIPPNAHGIKSLRILLDDYFGADNAK